MNIELNNKTIDKYFRFLFNLDVLTKKRLIKKLNESIKVDEKDNFDIASLHGLWEDSRSSDEIISDIKNSRVQKSIEIVL